MGPRPEHLRYTFAPVLMKPWLLIVLLPLLVPASASADGKKARELYRRGMAEYTLERWDAAIVQFEEGFRESPEPAFLFNIGQAHRKAGRHADAIRFFKKYLEFAPTTPDHDEVEKTIADEERRMAAEAAPVPSAPVATPPVAGAASPPVAAGLVAPPAPTALTPTAAPSILPPDGRAAAPRSAKKRWPLWLGVGVGAALVVGGIVGLAVAYTTPDDAAIPATSAGNINARFP